MKTTIDISKISVESLQPKQKEVAIEGMIVEKLDNKAKSKGGYTFYNPWIEIEAGDNSKSKITAVVVSIIVIVLAIFIYKKVKK